ncbi:Unknown protein [Striga hermonthica]|uniref:Uncharacterized protein n=1 Tax=Striga hermonthica TaxID=68872 RepID=A0A9N7NL97_STRHE|nr:Unknown protein [Striga hermonthica]
MWSYSCAFPAVAEDQRHRMDGVVSMGKSWRRLRMDEDGDIADEFLDEVPPYMEEHDKRLPRFEVKYSTKPAKVKNLDLLPNGRIRHLMEYQGKLEWV